jgi:hypothetical protein
VLVVLFLAAQTPAIAQTPGSTVRVRVQFEDSRQPSPGVLLTLRPPMTQSFSNGNATLNLPDNEADLLAYLQNLRSNEDCRLQPRH